MDRPATKSDLEAGLKRMTRQITLKLGLLLACLLVIFWAQL